MELLIVLVTVTLLARVAGQLGASALRDWRAATRVGLAAMFCVTAAAHFVGLREDLIRMVPPGIPHPELMVTLTGICELAGAAALLVPATRRSAAWAFIVFLFAVLPANVYAAQAGITLGGNPPSPLVPRILLQALLIAVIWWSGVAVPAPVSVGGTYRSTERVTRRSKTGA